LTFIFTFITYLKASKESELMPESEMNTVVEKSGVQVACGQTGNILLRGNQKPTPCWTQYVKRQFDVAKLSRYCAV
jgi:hypothetical protein